MSNTIPFEEAEEKPTYMLSTLDEAVANQISEINAMAEPITKEIAIEALKNIGIAVRIASKSFYETRLMNSITGKKLWIHSTSLPSSGNASARLPDPQDEQGCSTWFANTNNQVLQKFASSLSTVQEDFSPYDYVAGYAIRSPIVDLPSAEHSSSVTFEQLGLGEDDLAKVGLSEADILAIETAGLDNSPSPHEDAQLRGDDIVRLHQGNGEDVPPLGGLLVQPGSAAPPQPLEKEFPKQERQAVAPTAPQLSQPMPASSTGIDENPLQPASPVRPTRATTRRRKELFELDRKRAASNETVEQELPQKRVRKAVPEVELFLHSSRRSPPRRKEPKQKQTASSSSNMKAATTEQPPQVHLDGNKKNKRTRATESKKKSKKTSNSGTRKGNQAPPVQIQDGSCAAPIIIDDDSPSPTRTTPATNMPSDNAEIDVKPGPEERIKLLGRISSTRFDAANLAHAAHHFKKASLRVGAHGLVPFPTSAGATFLPASIRRICKKEGITYVTFDKPPFGGSRNRIFPYCSNFISLNFMGSQ